MKVLPPLLLLSFLISTQVSCATATRKGVVQVPIEVVQAGAWIEAEGVRYEAPALVSLDPSRNHEIVVASAAHGRQRLELQSKFQWQSLWLGVPGVAIDLATGAAWQVDGEAGLQVDLASGRWQSTNPSYMDSSAYRSAERKRFWGKGAVIGGAIAAFGGQVLMMSGVCYEECDPAATRRLAAGLALQTAALGVVIGGFYAWYKGRSDQRGLRRDFEAAPRW